MLHLDFGQGVALATWQMKISVVLFIYHKNFGTLQKYNFLYCTCVYLNAHAYLSMVTLHKLYGAPINNVQNMSKIPSLSIVEGAESFIAHL